MLTLLDLPSLPLHLTLLFFMLLKACVCAWPLVYFLEEERHETGGRELGFKPCPPVIPSLSASLFKGVVHQFGKHAYMLAGGELDEKINALNGKF